MAIVMQRPERVGEFLAAAHDFLAADEAENNLLFGLTDVIARHPEVYPECRFWIGGAGAGPIAAAVQTPPHNLILSTMAVADAALVAERIAGERDAVPLPGVLGPSAVAAAFAARYGELTGLRATVAMRERIFRIERVIAPRPVPGRWRFPAETDRPLLVAWAEAFRAEAVPDAATGEGEAIADRWLRRAGRTIYLWEDDGEVVSLAGAGGNTPRGIRIGPVYTPIARRGRGYASNLVAATTQHQFDDGREFCFLFTDLANPTSNKIYQALGYAPVIDVDQYRFT